MNRVPYPVISGYETPRGDATRPSTPVRGTAGNLILDAEKAMCTRPALSHHTNLNSMVSKAKSMTRHGKVGLRDRIACFQWTWFTMTMATGGVASVLYSVPFRAQWLDTLGMVFFIFNIVLFLLNCVLITMRFRLRPGSFAASFTEQLESLFAPAFLVSIATILVTISEYGVPYAGPWLIQALEGTFWVYVGASTFFSATMYLILWSTQVFPIHTMTPVWVFPAYPLLLTAPMATSLISAAINSGQLDLLNGIAVALCAVTVQGTGFLIGFTICAAFIYRLMTQKLPRDSQRPGVFISIGPSGFTVAGIVGLANQASDILPDGFMGTEDAVSIVKLLAFAVGLWLWGLSIWFFLVSVGSLAKYIKPDRKMPFQMTWFSFVFPNTALITATEHLAGALNCFPLQVIGCVMAGCIVLVWLLVFACMIRSLWKRQLLWPKEED